MNQFYTLPKNSVKLIDFLIFYSIYNQITKFYGFINI